MKVLIIGSGGRESAIAHAILRSKRDIEIHIATTNNGICNIFPEITAHNIKDSDTNEMVNLAKNISADVVIVGPETPLSLGIIDAMQQEGIEAFGPSKSASRLESSKIFMKDIVSRAGIPTAKYQSFASNQYDDACKFIDGFTGKVVLKTDGLAAGKGVVICDDSASAKAELKQFFDGKFGDAGKNIVIEEFLEGYEVSFFVISDGKNVQSFSHACDYKQIFDNGKGANTGGMGTFSPSPISAEMEDEIMNLTIKPLISQMNKEGCPFVGFLFAGLMMTQSGPKILEYNIRLGDPEAESILLRLKTDFIDIITSALDQNLCKIEFLDDHAVSVMLTARGYPEDYQKGDEITIGQINDAQVYTAGTVQSNGKLITNGGRVLAVSAKAKTRAEARQNAYNALSNIHFDGMHFRKDIGL